MAGPLPHTLRADHELTIEQIVALTSAKPRLGDPLDRRIANIAPLDTAIASDISFADSSKYIEALSNTHAGACFVAPRFEEPLILNVARLIHRASGVGWPPAARTAAVPR